MTVTRSVAPGDWYAVLGDTVLVLLPPAAKSRVAGVWERVDDGAGFDEVLDALISDGLRGLPGFVLVSTEADHVKVVIRGEGQAELTTAGGPVIVSGDEDTTWVEQNVAGASGVRVRVAPADGPPYLVGSGLHRVASVEQPPPAAASAPESPPVAAAAPSPPPTAAATAPPTPAPLPPALGDPVLGSGEEFVPTHLARPDPVPPVAAAVGAVARLAFSNGDLVEVDRAIVIGRSPEAGSPGDHQVRLVSVPSPHQEISSTHLEIRPGSGADQGSAVATDLGSTNGTVVLQPGLPPEDLRPGVAVALLPGAVVDLGDGVTIRVGPP